MNTADIKDDSGRQIDYESFLDYKKDFNDTRTLNFTSSEFFNDKRAQREDEFYDKAFYGGTAAVTAKLGYDYVNSGGAILEKFNALRSSNLLNERLKAASNASPFETLYQDFADPSTRSLSNSLQSQLLLLEELSPLHILKTLQISSFTTLFVEVVDSKNRQTIIGSESIRVYEKYYRNLIMNSSKISLSDANIDNGFILENKKLYQRLGNGDRGDVLLNYASAVNTNLEIGEQNSPNRVFQKFANIHGVDTRMDQFKKEPIAIVGGASKYKTQVDWMRAYTRFSMEIGYKVLDNPLGFVEEYSAALGAGESKVFQSKTFQMAKKVLNVNIGTGGVYNEGTRESLKMLTKNLGTKSLIGYLGYQGINSFLDDVTPESSVWNDGITSGIAANYAKGRVGFARAWSDRFQGYKERQEEAAPESTSLLTLIGLPLAGAMAGANAAYFQRMYDTKTMGAEAAAQKHSVEKKFQGYLGQSLEAINMNKASTTVRRYSKLGAVMTGALTLPFLPGALVGTSSEELAAEYSGDKEVAVRADRGWLMGGQALEGGKIKYHRKSLVAEGIANAKEKTLYENSDEKRAQDPIYSPFRYLKNPYAFEEAHTDDMPYPVWGMDVTYGSFLGKAFQGTFGKIIKPDVMNPIVENFGKGKTGLVDAGLNTAGLGTEEKGYAEQQLADFEGGRTRNEAYVVPVNEDSKTKSLVQSGDMMAAPSPISNANIRAAVGGYTAGSDFIGMKGFAGNLTSRAMGIDPEEQLEPQLAVSGSARTAKKSIIDMQLGDAGGCFIPTTRVMTKEGYKEIQDITTDDYVLSKESIYQKVNQVFPKLFKDTTLLKIDLGLGIKPIICTPDHVFPSLKRERYSKGHMKPNYSKIVSDREIGDLNVGDILIYQNIGDERLEYIDLKAKPIKNSFDKPTNNRYFSIDNNLYVSIKSIETLSYTGTLYDLNIENTPYYTVEDILCHNSGEFLRRLIPQSSATDKDSINPMANTVASDWLPSNETKYFKNFKRGDFYSETTEHGETLLPSKGFAELNPELKGVDPNDYPLVYQYKILQNVARGSSEHIATRNYLLENTDSLTEREQEIFFEAYGQEKDREQEKKFYEYKTSEDKAKLNILQTAQNALWESFSHKESPLEPLTPFRPMAKFLHQRTAIEDYKRTQIAGSDAAIWTKPNEHFISPTKNRLLQSFNGAYKPEDVQEKENIDEYFDKLALIKSLRTGDQYKAERTVAALASSGIRDASSMRQFKNALPDNQKPYVEAFAKETNAEKRREIMELLPTDIGRAYSSIWQNMDGLNYAKEHNLDPKEFLDSQYIKDSGILKNNKNIDLSSDVTEAIRVKSQDITSSSERKKYIDMAESKAIRLEAARRDAEEYIQHQTGALPEDDWVGWDPRLTIDDIKLKTLSVGKADLQRFGYWDKEIRRNDRIKILDKDTDIVNDYDDIRRSVKANTERRHQTKVALRKQGFEASRIDYIPSNKNAVRIINKQEYLNNFEE